MKGFQKLHQKIFSHYFLKISGGIEEQKDVIYKKTKLNW